MNAPLKARLTLLFVALFAVIVAAWSVFVVGVVRADLYSGIDSALGSRASQIALGLQGSGEGEFRDITETTLAGVSPPDATAQLLSGSGGILESSGEAIAGKPIVTPQTVALALHSGRPEIRTVSAPGSERLRVLVVKIGRPGQLVLVAMSTEAADSTVNELVLVMLLTGPLALLAAGAGGWFLSRRALRPVAQMTASAAGIGIDRLEERVPVPAGRDELAALATTLNGMLSRLESGVQDKRRLVADASHELQTPLAVMRTELDVSLASADLQPEAVEVLESTREEAERMSRIVRNLLTLARFDEGTLRLLRTPAELRSIAEEAAGSLAALAREQDVTVTLAGKRAPIEIDAEYIRLAVVNLVENAVKYSGRGSSVTIGTATEGDEAILSVSDTGGGIPPESLPLIFDRFYRIDGSRNRKKGGSGLGLPISREIVEAHGGHLDVESELGQGTTFVMRLPMWRDV